MKWARRIIFWAGVALATGAYYFAGVDPIWCVVLWGVGYFAGYFRGITKPD